MGLPEWNKNYGDVLIFRSHYNAPKWVLLWSPLMMRKLGLGIQFKPLHHMHGL